MSDLWKVAFGWFTAICISMSASLISGQCFGFALRCSLMEDVGLFIPFPFHLILLGIIMMFVSFLVFGLSVLIRKRKGTKIPSTKSEILNKKMYRESILLFVISCIVGLASLFVIALEVNLTSWWGLACLLPIPLTGGFLYLSFDIRSKTIAPQALMPQGNLQ